MRAPRARRPPPPSPCPAAEERVCPPEGPFPRKVGKGDHACRCFFMAYHQLEVVFPVAFRGLRCFPNRIVPTADLLGSW